MRCIAEGVFVRCVYGVCRCARGVCVWRVSVCECVGGVGVYMVVWD